MNFAVVHFPETEEVEVVPVIWIEEADGKCWWPHFKSTIKIGSAVKRMMPVDMHSWNLYNARVIKLFGKYSELFFIMNFELLLKNVF